MNGISFLQCSLGLGYFQNSLKIFHVNSCSFKLDFLKNKQPLFRSSFDPSLENGVF